MSDDVVPIIDIERFLAGDPQSRISTPRAVARACEEIGFFTIVGHGVDPAVIAAATSATRQFFELPPAEKTSARSADAAISRGYRGIGNEGLAGTRANETPPDLKEVFHLGPPDFPHDAYHCAAEAQPHFIDNVWPPSPAAFRPAATAYYRATEKLAADLMRIFALALDLPETFFADKIDRHISALRIINYPEQAIAPLPGQLRAGAHSDYGTLTILLGENQPGSLEVYTRSERWMPVHIPPDLVRHQYRRPDDALDERSLDLDAASGGQPARGGGRAGAAALARVLPSSELRRRSGLHSDLRRRRQSAALPAGQGRALPPRQVRASRPRQASRRVMPKTTFVLVHGAWQGAWAWETIVPRLAAAGHDAIAVDLPGNGHDQTPPAAVDVDLYARHIAGIVDGIAGPIVLVGHSMGGTAVAQACELRSERIALAIYLAAFLLPDGMSVLKFYEQLSRTMDARGAKPGHLQRRWVALLDRSGLGHRGVLPSGRSRPCRGGGAPVDAAAGRRPPVADAAVVRAIRAGAARLYRGDAGPVRSPAVAAADARRSRRASPCTASTPTMRRNCLRRRR